MARRMPTARKNAKAEVVTKAISWTDHPIIIATSSCAATILLCLTVFNEFVLPLRTAELELEVSRTREAYANISSQLTKESARVKILDRDLKGSREQLIDLKSQLLEARSGNLFSSGSAYPIGYNLVRIGMPFEDIKKFFPTDNINIDPESPYIARVNLTDSPFERIVYFAKNGKVSHLSISLPIINDFPNGFLQRKLIESFGHPHETRRKRFYYWSIADGMNIYKSDDYSIIIMDSSFSPSYWPGINE